MDCVTFFHFGAGNGISILEYAARVDESLSIGWRVGVFGRGEFLFEVGNSRSVRDGYRKLGIVARLDDDGDLAFWRRRLLALFRGHGGE